MAAARHRQENDPTGPRQRWHLPRRKVVAPAVRVTVATGGFIGVHQLSQRPASQAVDLSAGARAATSQARPAPADRERLRAVSRSASRSLVAKQVTLQPRAVAHRYATAPL